MDGKEAYLKRYKFEKQKLFCCKRKRKKSNFLYR